MLNLSLLIPYLNFTDWENLILILYINLNLDLNLNLNVNLNLNITLTLSYNLNWTQEFVLSFYVECL